MADAGFSWGDLATPAIAAAAVVVTKLLDRNQARTTPRDLILKDLALVKELPDTPAKKALMADIERRVQAIADSGVKRRDPLGVTLAVILVLVAALGASIGFQSEGVLRAAWFTFAGASGVIGVFGFAQSVISSERDAKGRPVR